MRQTTDQYHRARRRHRLNYQSNAPTKHRHTSTMNPYLNQYISKGQTVILGLSGGPDSVYLLHQCLELQKKIPFTIIIVHIEHGLRGEESIKDAEFCHQLAKTHNLTFELLSITEKPKGNLEDRFRQIRYNFFEELRKQYKADYILTAHHLNDNIETILLNLTRGTFLEGLAGMDIYDPKRHLLRPLLETKRSDIESYLKKHKLPYRTDSTNENTDFSRNLIRKNVIPELKKINKNMEQTFLQNIKNFKGLKAFLNQHLKNWIKNNSDKNGIKVTSFLELPENMQKNILFYLYNKTHGNNNLSQNHIKQLLQIIKKNRSGLKKEFGPGHQLSIIKQNKNSERIIQILKKPAK